ncbi:ABC-type transport auxiliary lipoprotein family protein [Phenylobacterium sp.]|uniref:ABC-type transport auxiliary lipoprotein family protein n=1 Tax=Phenylobacterium sp. TaxID=1871053 RepID=UPI003983B470
MIRPTNLLRLAVIGASALALSGCISLFPKTKPVHLYRFGQPATAAGPVQAGTVGVFRANGVFQQESAGDRLLTVTNGKVAYVADTRWAAAASVLFDQAVLAAFDADPGRTRLVSRGEAASADYILRIDMRNFETRYDAGPEAAPTVVVRLRAAMTRGVEGAVLADQIFESRVPAGDNRVTAIVPAYDRAVADVLGQLVAWTNTRAVPKT